MIETLLYSKFRLFIFCVNFQADSELFGWSFLDLCCYSTLQAIEGIRTPKFEI